jgi:hypothetical protein
MSARDALPITMFEPPARPSRLAAMETTRTGITIGAAYVPPPHRMQGHALKVQAALLEKRTLRPPSLLRRVLSPVWRWL